jgi:hypothetical protein
MALMKQAMKERRRSWQSDGLGWRSDCLALYEGQSNRLGS